MTRPKHRSPIREIGRPQDRWRLGGVRASLILAALFAATVWWPAPLAAQSMAPRVIVRESEEGALPPPAEYDVPTADSIRRRLSDEEIVPAPRPTRGRELRNSTLLDRQDKPLELVEFRETTVYEACRLLSDQTGLKIVPSADAGKTVVSLYLRDVRPGVAIDAMTKAHGLFYREDLEAGLIRIYTTDEYEKSLSSFREERTQVFTLLYPNPLEVAFAIRGAFGNRVQLTLNGQQVNSQQLQELIQRFMRFNIVDQQSRLLGGTTSTTGTNQGAGGFGAGAGGIGGGFGGLGGFGFGGVGGGMGGGLGGFGSGMGLGNGFGGGFGFNQFNNQQQNNQDEPPRRLEDLTPEQIQQLEAGGAAVDDILRTRKADIFVAAVPRNNQLVVRTADVQSMERIEEMIEHLDVPTPLVLLEVQVLALDLSDDFSSSFDYQFTDGNVTAGGFNNNVNNRDFTTGNILPPAADAIGPSRFDPIAPGPLGTAPANNMTFQVVSANFRMRLQLLETKNRVTQLATPVLLTANNEVSRIFIGQTVPIVTGYTQGGAITSVGGTASVFPTPQTQLQNVGQTLLITPNINADRTVTLRVAQEESKVSPDQAKIPFPDPNGGAPQNLSVDVVHRTTVSGTVVAKDGLTVAIGGLIREDLTDRRQQVPVLGKLPIVGIAFRGQQTIRARTELVVLIRPYIFNTPQESAGLSHDLVSVLSVHPHAPEAVGTMNSFSPHEVLRAHAPLNPLQGIFRLHSLVPKAY